MGTAVWKGDTPMSEPVVVPLWPQAIAIGKDVYTRCADCGKVVRLNKWIFGGLHVCA